MERQICGKRPACPLGYRLVHPDDYSRTSGMMLAAIQTLLPRRACRKSASSAAPSSCRKKTSPGPSRSRLARSETGSRVARSRMRRRAPICASSLAHRRPCARRWLGEGVARLMTRSALGAKCAFDHVCIASGSGGAGPVYSEMNELPFRRELLDQIELVTSAVSTGTPAFVAVR